MFRTISIIALVGAFVLAVVAGLSKKRGAAQGATLKRGGLLGLLDFFKMPVYLLAIVCAAALIITGFVPKVILGRTIYGYWLMIHATAAPVFACSIAFLAVMWAARLAYDKGDLPGSKSDSEIGRFSFAQKTLSWMILFLALPLIISIVLSMLPLFGTHYQELLLLIHRWCAVAVACAVIIHTALTVRA